jgi:predicted nucleic acid-binding protein
MTYLDTSVVLPLFQPEARSLRLEGVLGHQPPGALAFSQWGQMGFASAVSREVRTRHLQLDAANALLRGFDRFCVEALHIIPTTARDFDLASRYVRAFDTALRAPDALYLALAKSSVCRW